ncbi:MAG TPA: Sec-independent protein translocase protein TatB [Candidatus Pelagibacter bacterium]|jgi:sec-independent protein translocase protein TatB|nr:twin-arginine translocase subunit TatB [Pelagibacteraceae bacterium]HJN83993.1 Sec-independent protein translocase protein TatB [Candidatus Pelagibacter bacterium]|tara:strand:- start:53 stop:280 length:228 start_codon:yes stop_codon:yes gene_type:complete
MPQIGWFEILIIVAIAIIVIGPKDFPFVLKKIGSWIGSAKRYVSNIQKEVSDISDDNFEIKPKETNIEKEDNVKK